MLYTLEHNGDNFERKYWKLFLKLKFPSYEKYWVSKIVPLTQRPARIHFKSGNELVIAGYSAEDVCKAQLHYTVLRQLAGAYEILIRLQSNKLTHKDSDTLAEGLFHIGAAQDVAFEFLQRNKTPNIFDPWTSSKRLSKSSSTPGSQEACKKWKTDNKHPLNHIREYRNHMTHGRMLPSLVDDSINQLYLPKIGLELNYLDWRSITDPPVIPKLPSDYDSVANILSVAFDITIDYFETEWQKL